MLFASLIDDPGEHLPEKEAERERHRLFELLERLSSFDSYNDAGLIAQVRAEIAKAVGTASPVVVDPFCGGGSTALEAQRLGLRTQASDLNQIPILITTVLCRVPGLFGDQPAVSSVRNPTLFKESARLGGFKADVTYYAARVRELAWQLLGNFYPSIGGATPFAYRWAWTVASPDPSARGRHTPLVSNWWLSRHRASRAWIRPVDAGDPMQFEIRSDGEPQPASTGRTGATCLHSGTPIPLEYVRTEGRAGRLRRTMIAIAARDGASTIYVAPDNTQIAAATAAPATELPGIPMPKAALGFRVQQYGVNNFLDLFTNRQAHAIETFAGLVSKVREEVVEDAIRAGLKDDGLSLEAGGRGGRAYADAIAAVLGLCVGKMAQSNNILVRWFLDPRNGSGKATPAFDRHAIPMVWDFVETNPFGGSVGDWVGPVLETALRAFEHTVPEGPPTVVLQRDARLVASDLPPNALVATDPPYYANIGYADLSDFFYLWLRVALRGVFPALFSTVATPKDDELIATPHRHGGQIELANEYFRTGFSDVFGSLAKVADPRFPILIVYAIKQAEEAEEGIHSTGWEVFLGGLVDSGMAVVATWPVRTTTDTRMIGIGTNALASAIFVVGRRRRPDAPTATRREFVTTLKKELPVALAHLQRTNIAPVDLAQAAIGPGMAVYTRYARVLDAEGKPLSVRDALALINQTLDEALAKQEGDFDADTRWALAWFEQSGFEEGDYGVAETLSKAKNTSVEGMVTAGILASSRGKVRLLTPNELPDGWDPTKDARLTAWEMVHQLIRSLEVGGEGRAATLAAKLGSKAEIARELAYRLYTLCERKKRAAEALAYNGLVQSFPEIARLAREGPRPAAAGTDDLFRQE